MNTNENYTPQAPLGSAPVPQPDTDPNGNPNPCVNPNPILSAYPYPDPNPAPYSAAGQLRKGYTLDRADRIFAGILLGSTLLGVVAGLWGGFQLGFTVSFLVQFILYSVYLGRGGAKAGAYAWTCGALAVCMAPIFFLTSGQLVRFLALCLMAVLSVIWLSALAGKRIYPGEMGLAKRFLVQLGRMTVHMPRSVAALFSSSDPRTKRFMKALLGLLCAVPLLGIVVTLLIRSDAAFEGLMRRLFSNVGQTIIQIILTLLVFPFLLAFGFSTRKDEDKAPTQSAFKGVDTLFLSAFLSVPAVCYLVYLFSQLAYFFSAFSGILPEGYTFSYAEYARRGFFELCGIAGINLCLLYLMLLLSKKTNEKPPVVLRVLGTFIDLFTLLLICTVVAKMVLYIRQYGVTVLRLGTSAFMLFMAVVFLALLLRFYLPRVRVLPVAVVTASLVVLALGIGNMHAFAAWYNYTAYEKGTLDAIDTAYLRRLGDEGIPYLIRLADEENEDKVLRGKACGQLCIAIEDRYEGEYKTIPRKGGTDEIEDSYFVPTEKAFGKLTRFSIPRSRAYAELDALLERDPEFLKRNIDERAAAYDDEYTFFD